MSYFNQMTAVMRKAAERKEIRKPPAVGALRAAIDKSISQWPQNRDVFRLNN